MAATGTLPALPITICPACPTAVERGKDGISEYGTRVAASANSSANPPSPDPSTTPILGRNLVWDSTNCAADSLLANSSDIRFRAFNVSKSRGPPDCRLAPMNQQTPSTQKVRHWSHSARHLHTVKAPCGAPHWRFLRRFRRKPAAAPQDSQG